MGANEDELERIRANGRFAAPELGALRNSMAALALTIKDIAGSPGWEGLSASAASAYLEDLSRRYLEIETALGDVQTEIDNANRIRTAALADYDALPSAKAPSWVHDTLDAFDFPGIPQPVDLAQGGLELIENFLGDQREQAAGRILAAYREALGDPAVRTSEVRDRIGELGSSVESNSFPTGDQPGDTTTGTWTSGGAYRGTGYTGVEFLGGGGYPPYRPPTIDDDDVEVGVDDTHTGVLPGGGSGGGGSTGTGGSGGGGLPGAAGIGAGSAIAGAGALAATRLGGGAGAMARGGVRVGTGGLLGAGAPGPGAGAASNSTAARGTTAGARGGSGLLGSSGVNGAPGRGEERKRKAGRGLGGPIAPKLDDEDDVILPGSGARAGGRDEPAAAELDG
jgi:hypothetical protein